ncbi:MAG: hypothetical protein EAZ60_25940 [Oscillatoriales cyanobacterium]|nr:MAG: hypothetical protein EAZ83_31210 [Oscillatoriales cyanobacterium]TAF12919.1 MAG: hypothetical protein EAZ73_31090 [Oscillatoriales cyanobacterium]TAF31581.1 MAG: hypothetical protein EAZ69_19105 [Oscillatoriales cyanobacterium]TAF51541.1 MAG: hypothetical protein EAZ60_25940 [Oscillatoriales cyanobacterium]
MNFGTGETPIPQEEKKILGWALPPILYQFSKIVQHSSTPLAPPMFWGGTRILLHSFFQLILQEEKQIGTGGRARSRYFGTVTFVRGYEVVAEFNLPSVCLN